MSPLTEPTRLVLAKTYVGVDDPDAAAYIAAVEAADEAASPGVGALETATKVAIHSFVKGCKADGIWPAIKASCILAGARTLEGALVPLAGTAPTNFNFVAGDYNRKTGLKGDGLSKSLNSNRNNTADPQTNFHKAAHATQVDTGTLGRYINTSNCFIQSFNSVLQVRAHASSSQIFGANAVGLIGISRSVVSEYILRSGGSSAPAFQDANSYNAGDIFIYGGGSNFSTARLAFYSIGESLDLALLDARVTDLINKFAEVIP